MALSPLNLPGFIFIIATSVLVYNWWLPRFPRRDQRVKSLRTELLNPAVPGDSIHSAEMNTLGRSEMTDDEPAPVPPLIAMRLPRFGDCGVPKCHDHYHSEDDIRLMVSKSTALLNKANQNAHKHNERTARHIEIIGRDVCWPMAACRDCHRVGLVVGLHRLKCGHALCHGCLTNAARSFYGLMENSETREDIKGLLESGGIWGRRAEAARDPRYKKECAELARGHIDDAYFEAQATCCNTRIDYTDFIRCLDPKDACRVWLSTEEMQTATKYRTKLRCGWPDCGKYLPLQFVWDTLERPFGHCISCGGNSKLQGQSGTMCPAR